MPAPRAARAAKLAPKNVSVVVRAGLGFQRLQADLRCARVERRERLLRDVVDTIAYAP